MNAVWIPLCIGIGIQGLGAWFQLWMYRRLREEDKPSEALQEMQRDMVKVREDIARIKGRINGHAWRQEA